MLLIVLVFILSLIAMVPLGAYTAGVMEGKDTFFTRWLKPLERLIYYMCGIREGTEMRWPVYAGCIVLFGLVCVLFLFFLLMAQGMLPFNPADKPGLSADLAFNVAVSFVTNTNWQSYSGETSLSPLSQMAGLAVQNFLSAGVGISVAFAVFRCFVRQRHETIGNFWVDITRAVLYILLPLSLLLALLLVSQGVVQSFTATIPAETMEGIAQTIYTGPVASQVAIKMIGANGGGYFSANASHPFENPTAFSNLLQLVAIFLLPASLIYSFGVIIRDRRQAFALLCAVLLIFLPLLSLTVWQEGMDNPSLSQLPHTDPEGNMEGKEMRFGYDASALWSVATTATSNGSVNAMHDSFMPLSNLAQLLLMQCGVVFGGVGSGIYGLLVFVIISVFIGNLMIGRTPEYLGKKVGPFEIKMASLFIIMPGALILMGSALAVMTEAGQSGTLNPGPYGFSEIIYAATSAATNNGSALAGISANSPFYNTLLGVLMYVGRYFTIIPVLAMAGALSSKNTVPVSAGTLPTHTPLFCGMLVMVTLLVNVLTYVPALALGPIVEHLNLVVK